MAAAFHPTAHSGRGLLETWLSLSLVVETPSKGCCWPGLPKGLLSEVPKWGHGKLSS